LFCGRIVRSRLVSTTVKFVESVLTRLQAKVFVPVDAHPEFWLGWVTWNADAQSASARVERDVAVKERIVARIVLHSKMSVRRSECRRDLKASARVLWVYLSPRVLYVYAARCQLAVV